MKITIEIDTEKEFIAPKSNDMNSRELLEWLLNHLPETMGTYYGRLAARHVPRQAHEIIQKAIDFPSATTREIVKGEDA